MPNEPLAVDDLWKRSWKVILVAGLFVALTAYLLHGRNFAAGVFVGTLLSLLDLQFLKLQTQRAVQKGRGGNLFFLGSFSRWAILALVFGALAQRSIVCLWGALLAFLFSVLLLVWMGWPHSAISRAERR